MTGNSRQKFKYLNLYIVLTKRAFEVNKKAFFINFKGLSTAENCLWPESAPLGNNYFGSQSFFMSCHFIKIFVQQFLIAAVQSFNIFKLIEWGPANTYLKSIIETLEKGMKCVQN